MSIHRAGIAESIKAFYSGDKQQIRPKGLSENVSVKEFGKELPSLDQLPTFQ